MYGRKNSSGNLFFHNTADVVYRNTLLLHRIAITDGNSMVFFCLMIDRYAERSSDRIHPAVSLSNSVFLFVKAPKVIFTAVKDLPCDLRQSVFLRKGQNCQFNGR